MRSFSQILYAICLLYVMFISQTIIYIHSKRNYIQNSDIRTWLSLNVTLSQQQKITHRYSNDKEEIINSHIGGGKQTGEKLTTTEDNDRIFNDTDAAGEIQDEVKIQLERELALHEYDISLSTLF